MASKGQKGSGGEQEAVEAQEDAAARCRELLAETQRLEAHVSDLETRKRAPLYQKKQEEELRAALEKAADSDLRATQAELKYKDAKVRLPRKGRAKVR